ncbi:TPA: hypothetical protein L4R55_002556 [Pseudomonas aeruginosa]|nr:hypothetical protein [Pseudomonas aeruginosa]
MVERLTAAQAREISGPTQEEVIESLIDEALAEVRKAAEQKRREVTLRSGAWADEAYRRTPLWLDLAKRLQKLGYAVDVYYVESQFVDVGTTIKW